MKQILFPLKTNPSTNTDKKWEAMDPLCFAEYISRQLADSQSIQNDITTVTSSHNTTNKVTLAERRGQKPLQINTKFLSQDFSPNIPSSPHPSNAIGSLPPNLASKVMKDIQVSPEPIPLADSHNLRKRPISKLLLPTIVPNDDDLNDDCEGSPSWDPYFLILHNPHDPTAAQLITKEMCDLARYFESMPKYTDCISSYRRFQTELFRNSELICNSANGVQEKIRKFTQLYSDALLHMKSLISTAQNLQHESNTSSTITDNVPNHVVSTHEDVPKKYHHGIVVSTQKIYSKKEFTEVMNQWLVDNWTNPYPDDEGIAYLAELNGTTPTIVSNWLINARTRKWRPAIVKAYDARRPADLLKEDSIRIFQRKPLRKLV